VEEHASQGQSSEKYKEERLRRGSRRELEEGRLSYNYVAFEFFKYCM
jgi:hypothetical protein